MLEDGREVTITASPREVDEAEAGEPGLPSPETMQAAEQAVAEQAAIVRSLKEQNGLTNQVGDTGVQKSTSPASVFNIL